MIKADAYGHGAVPVAKALAADGVSRFGVALVEEARALRQGGIRGEILVLGGVWPDQAADVVDLELSAAVFQRATADALNAAARRADRVIPIHVKIDTGMGRLGYGIDEAVEAIVALARYPALRLDGVMTHFADADLADRAFARAQMTRFSAVCRGAADRGVGIPLRHAANSAMLMSPETEPTIGDPSAGGGLYEAARPGIMLYGCRPGPAVGEGIELRPVLSITTKILLLKRVPAGTPISYGRTFTTRRPSTIAVLPIGYADGYPRALSNRGSVLVRGARAPVVGRVCMDLTMIDVTEIPGVTEGDEVTLLGAQGDHTISAEEIADQAGTISYEVLCGIGPRVPRRYHDGESAVNA